MVVIPERKTLRDTLENMGVTKVREKLHIPSGFNKLEAPIVEAWLREKEEEEERGKFSEELRLSEEANSIAKSAKNVSIAAIVVSIISLLVVILVAIFK